MAASVRNLLGNRLAGGMVVTKYSHGAELKTWTEAHTNER